MNGTVAKISAVLSAVLFLASAALLLVENYDAFYIVSIILSLSVLSTASGLGTVRRVTTQAAVYGTIIFSSLFTAFSAIVYFTQLTSVKYINSFSTQMIEMLKYGEPHGILYSLSYAALGFCALGLFSYSFAVDKEFNRCGIKQLLRVAVVFAVLFLVMPMANLLQNEVLARASYCVFAVYYAIVCGVIYAYIGNYFDITEY